MLQITFHTVLSAAILLKWTIRIVVSDCNSLPEWTNPLKYAEKTVLVEKICFIRMLGNNLMMTLYFSACLNAQNCSLIFLVWLHFSKVFSRDGHDKLAFSGYFRTLIFPRSLLSCRLYHTYSHALTSRLTDMKFIWNFNVFDWRNKW